MNRSSKGQKKKGIRDRMHKKSIGEEAKKKLIFRCFLYDKRKQQERGTEK